MLITFSKLDKILGYKSGYVWKLCNNKWRGVVGYKLDNRVWVMEEDDALEFVAKYGEDKLKVLQDYIKERKVSV